jgi:putative tricarboxylic transport membrane protein
VSDDGGDGYEGDGGPGGGPGADSGDGFARDAAGGGQDDGRVEGTTDRATGALVVVLGIAAAWASRGFVVGFPADPVGPRALPLFSAAILVAAAGALLLRPDPDPRWPGRRVALRLGVAVALLFAYPPLLPLTGFIVTTGGAVALLSLLFGGPPLRSTVAAFLFAGGLYLLFVYALGIPLPLGRLFLAGGGA